MVGKEIDGNPGIDVTLWVDMVGYFVDDQCDSYKYYYKYYYKNSIFLHENITYCSLQTSIVWNYYITTYF